MRWWLVFYDTAPSLLGGVLVTADRESDAIEYAIANALVPVGTATTVPQRAPAFQPNLPAPTPALADDVFLDPTEIGGFQAVFGSPYLGFQPESGEELNRLGLSSPEVMGITSGTDHDFEWDPETILETVGSSLSVDGGDPTVINVSEGGIYAVTLRPQILAEVGGEMLLYQQLDLNIGTELFRLYADHTTAAVGPTQLTESLLGVAFVPNGGTITATSYIETSGTGDWRAIASLLIQQTCGPLSPLP